METIEGVYCRSIIGVVQCLSFRTLCKFWTFQFLAEIRADELWCFLTCRWVESKFKWPLLCVIIKNSWINHHQNYPRYLMRRGVTYKKITLFGSGGLRVNSYFGSPAHFWAAVMTGWVGVSSNCAIHVVVCRLSAWLARRPHVWARVIEVFWQPLLTLPAMPAGMRHGAEFCCHA